MSGWTVTGLNLNPPPQCVPPGERLIASASVTYGDIGFSGVFLVEREDRQLSVRLPGRGKRRCYLARESRDELIRVLLGAVGAIRGNAVMPFAPALELERPHDIAGNPEPP